MKKIILNDGDLINIKSDGVTNHYVIKIVKSEFEIDEVQGIDVITGKSIKLIFAKKVNNANNI